jgi:hypothetical protein
VGQANALQQPATEKTGARRALPEKTKNGFALFGVRSK